MGQVVESYDNMRPLKEGMPIHFSILSQESHEQYEDKLLDQVSHMLLAIEGNY